MAKKGQEDLFASSTMSFGEHLEELRVNLTRAVLGLLIGCVAGLFLAKRVVNWIETPVKSALKRHMVLVAQDELAAKYGGALDAQVNQLVEDNVLVFEEVLLERSQLATLMDQVQQAESKQAESKQAESKEVESKEVESKEVESKEVESKEVESKQAEANPAQPKPDRTELPRAVLDELNSTLPPPQGDFVKTRIWHRAEAKIQSLNPYEGFVIYLKAALVVGAVLASPYVFLQIWSFVAAGLYSHEKKYVYVFLPVSLGLFLAGAALAFLLVFEPVLDFLFSYNRAMNIAPDMRINDIISFVLLLPLGFGVSFQLPLVMLFLNRLGILSLEILAGKWRIAILLIFVISMMLTPGGDPISMALMAVPLTGLYFLGLAMIKWMPRSRNPFGEE